ncbi:MAG: DUF1559 domain-containing protein [Aureliella sp.]
MANKLTVVVPGHPQGHPQRHGVNWQTGLTEAALHSRGGFTVVELMVVTVIIGLLVALLLPAVQAVREGARRLQCSNNVKQLSLAALNFEGTFQHLPSGGWGIRWAGLPNRGVGTTQPGGWIYQTLPFCEQQALFNLGGTEPSLHADNARRIATPLAILHCPSRRAAEQYANPTPWRPHYCAPVSAAARNDYAMNGGDTPVRYGPGPDSLGEAARFDWPNMHANTGICYQRSEIRASAITDGLSSTYLLGEKHLPTAAYYTGTDFGDNEGAYSGDERDLIRYTGNIGMHGAEPIPDRISRVGSGFHVEGYNFGAAHTSGVNLGFCDGSVRAITYGVDPLVHRHLGNRKDAQTIPSDAVH